MRTATKLQNNLEILQISGGVFSKKICVYAHTYTHNFAGFNIYINNPPIVILYLPPPSHTLPPEYHNV